MDTLVNTAKIEFEAKLQQVKSGGVGGNDLMDGVLL